MALDLEPAWSTAWSGEMAFRLQPSADFPGRLELDQKEAPGEGSPLYALVHVSRQRRGMAKLLCHVCGRPTPAHDRYIFPVASGGMVTLQDGSEQYGCNVPPIHRACAGRAMGECPHLGRLAERPVRCPEEGRLIPRTDITPGLEGVERMIPQGAEVIFSCYRLYSPAFTAEVADARERWERRARARRSGG